jgi:hypothetical protein
MLYFARKHDCEACALKPKCAKATDMCEALNGRPPADACRLPQGALGPHPRRCLGCASLGMTLLEGPVFCIHESGKRHAPDTEAGADVWNFNGVRFNQFGRDNDPVFAGRAGNYERIGHPAAAQQLLLLDVLLKVRNSIDLGESLRLILGRMRDLIGEDE